MSQKEELPKEEEDAAFLDVLTTKTYKDKDGNEVHSPMISIARIHNRDAPISEKELDAWLARFNVSDMDPFDAKRREMPSVMKEGNPYVKGEDKRKLWREGIRD